MMKKIMVIASLTLLVAFGVCFFELARLTLESAAARQHVEIILDAERKALSGSVQEAVEQMKFIRDYYPSGTRLRRGGKLDRIVEAVRQNSNQHIERTKGATLESSAARQ